MIDNFYEKVKELDKIYHFKFNLNDDILENTMLYLKLKKMTEIINIDSIKRIYEEEMEQLSEKIIEDFQRENKEILTFIKNNINK